VTYQFTEAVAQPGRNPQSRGRSASEIANAAAEDPRKAAALARARARIGQHIKAVEEKVSLASLRLGRGLSQAQLAAAIDRPQSYIAKVESGRNNDLRASTILRLAEALQTDANTIIASLAASEESRP